MSGNYTVEQNVVAHTQLLQRDERAYTTVGDFRLSELTLIFFSIRKKK